MAAKVWLAVASLVAVASANGCGPGPKGAENSPTPTLPSTGATDLPAPDSGLVLKKLTVGHGIQNYTCINSTATPAAIGALAVLYDIMPLYPGTPGVNITQAGFDAISTTVLWSQSLPLNLEKQSAAPPSAALSESVFAADPTQPFLDPVPDLSLGPSLPPLKFAGIHFFRNNTNPVFKLNGPPDLVASVGKKFSVKAPAGATTGLLNTGTVDWLRLEDVGGSDGVKIVYRVVTAGGSPQTCDVSGPGTGSVPYSAQYWFYG